MKRKTYLMLLAICLLHFMSCKKDSQKQASQQTSFKAGLLTFSIDSELLNATIDTTKDLVTVIVPRTADMSKLKVNFTLASQANASINNTIITSGVDVDFSKVVYLTVASADKKRSTTFQLQVMTDLQYFGVTGKIISEKSLNKTYNYYFDQFDGSPYQGFNCGPTVSTMALKWADSNFSKKPVDARNFNPKNGNWWSTGDVTNYLRADDVNFEADTLSNLDSLVKVNIDNNRPIILCLDMFYVLYNDVYYQHTDKFYITSAPQWGHFLLVKGYKQTNTGFFLEIYDPYSQGKTYQVITAGQLEGKDRYYASSGIKSATDIWWPYGIIVASKGQQITASTSTRLSVNSISKGKAVPVAYGR